MSVVSVHPDTTVCHNTDSQRSWNVFFLSYPFLYQRNTGVQFGLNSERNKIKMQEKSCGAKWVIRRNTCVKLRRWSVSVSKLQQSLLSSWLVSCGRVLNEVGQISSSDVWVCNTGEKWSYLVAKLDELEKVKMNW